MSHKGSRIFISIFMLLLASLACYVPSVAPASTATPALNNAASLSSTQTELAAQSTNTPEKPSETPVFTETPSPQTAASATLEVGVFPTETPSPTPEILTAEVMKESSCRIGPAANYELVTTLKTGTVVEIEARDMGGGFIFVKVPDQSGVSCYILANNARVSGDMAALPQYTPAASPTAAPNFTATFKKFDFCKGNPYAQFVIQNTGSVAFRSAYIRVTDTRTNEVVEQVVNAFDLMTGCIIAKNIAPLDPGATGYLSSPAFKRDPRENRLRVAIQACTEKNLKGGCVTISLEIKP